jgi:hypothetical protein
MKPRAEATEAATAVSCPGRTGKTKSVFPSLYRANPISGCRCSPPMGLAGLGIGGVIPNVVAKRRHNSDFVIHC